MSHYKILGINNGVYQQEIKKAFNDLALIHHPNNGGVPEDFHRINEAYEVLKDPILREKYDSDLEQSVSKKLWKKQAKHWRSKWRHEMEEQGPFWRQLQVEKLNRVIQEKWESHQMQEQEKLLSKRCERQMEDEQECRRCVFCIGSKMSTVDKGNGLKKNSTNFRFGSKQHSKNDVNFWIEQETQKQKRERCQFEPSQLDGDWENDWQRQQQLLRSPSARPGSGERKRGATTQTGAYTRAKGVQDRGASRGRREATTRGTIASKAGGRAVPRSVRRTTRLWYEKEWRRL